MADFQIRIFEGDSWKKVSEKKLKVPSPRETDVIDVYAGCCSLNGMKALYKHLLWKKGDFSIIKPDHEIGTIEEWGPIFWFKFKFSVTKYPKEPEKVGVKY